MAIFNNSVSFEKTFKSNHGDIIQIANIITQKIVRTLIDNIVTSLTRCLNHAQWLYQSMGCIHCTIPNIGIKNTINALFIIPYAAIAILQP